MPTLAIVKGENEESAATDNNSSRRKNDLGETADGSKIRSDEETDRKESTDEETQSNEKESN